jgi:hypothetical protein
MTRLWFMFSCSQLAIGKMCPFLKQKKSEGLSANQKVTAENVKAEPFNMLIEKVDKILTFCT